MDGTFDTLLNSQQSLGAFGLGATWSLDDDTYLIEAILRPQVFHNDIINSTDFPASISLLFNQDWLHVKTTGSYLVREPLMDEALNLYSFTGFLANPNLKPETGYSWDSSVEVDYQQWTFKVAPTASWISNEITYLMNPDYTSQNVNASGTSTHFVLVNEVDYQLFKWAKLFTSYTYTKAVDSTGTDLPLISTHTFRLGADSDFGGASLTSYSPYTASGSKTTVVARNEVDAYLQHAFKEGFKLRLDGKNLLDDRTPSEVYYDGWYPSEGRTFTASASWAF